MSDTDVDLDFESQEEKDEFVRGVMLVQVWAKVVKEDPGDLANLAKENREICEEWDKAMKGGKHEFGVKIADHFGLPYHHAGDTIKLGRPYGERYRRAWVDLGVEPSMAEKIASSVMFGVLSRD